jgi:vanillate O-demethylase ferredoxin subunit
LPSGLHHHRSVARISELNFSNVHVERFAPPGEMEAAQDSTYRVKLKRSKKTLDYRAGKSLLDALVDAGVDCAYSCHEGVRGVCEMS